MYHYVRELAETRFKKIRGLNLSLFREQISYLKRYYEFVTVDECLEAMSGGGELPRNAALLTFDDGYIDHYINVFPILNAESIQGCFFPVVRSVCERKVLDVNKIQFLLASIKEPEILKKEVFNMLNRLRSEGYEIEPNEVLYNKLAIRYEWDPTPIVFIKRLLQRELPQNLRSILVDGLFKKYVTTDEKAFARELYMSEEQLSLMVRHGMHIGSHGHEHRWMDTLKHQEQFEEIDSSLELLKSIGMSLDSWLMCYPYGGHNKSLRKICHDLGCGMAFTTEVGIAQINEDNALTLPRLDTNHLPKDANHLPNNWTKKIL
jgi:peptidoglycan/xylan/chitin deacetylase (PgdA/CDA1 family)